MNRIISFLVGQVVPSAFLNQFQDNALGIAQVPGLMLGPPYVWCTNGLNIHIGPITFAMLGNTNAIASTSIVTDYAAAGLSNYTWYYLYARFDSGAILFDHDTVPPSAGLVFKTDDTTRQYICSFITNDDGDILPFRKVRNAVTYQRSRSPFVRADFLAVGDSHSAAFVTHSLSRLLPPHSLIAMVEFFLHSASAAYVTATMITGGDIGSFEHVIESSTINTNISSYPTIVTNASQEVQCKVAASSDTVEVFCCGYVE